MSQRRQPLEPYSISGLVTLTGDFAGVAVCEDTSPKTVADATAPPTKSAPIVLRIVLPTESLPEIWLDNSAGPQSAPHSSPKEEAQGCGQEQADEGCPGQAHGHAPRGRDLTVG